MGATGLAEAIARIETRYGTRAVVRGDVAERQDGERRIASGTSLDRVTGGGIRAGEPLAFIGPLTAGKLALALHVAAAAQREGGMVARIDPSASFDPLAAVRAGVELDRVVVVRARDLAEVLLAGAAALRSEGFRLAVVDVGPSFASRCGVDDLAPLLPVVRGSPAALLVVAEERGRRIALPMVRVEPLDWRERFGRTVGWSFAACAPSSRERALFAVTALGARASDLGTRAELAELGELIAAVVVRDATEILHARALITLRAMLPHVGVIATGTFACDLAGTERVLGAPSRIARRILERLVRIGAQTSVGVAVTPFAARVAAERTAPGDTRLVTDVCEFLTPLPLDVLPFDEKLRDELGLLGLRTVGDFAGLPRGAVFDRFGRGAARAHALARAEDEERVHADPPPRRIYARRLWEEPLASKEQLVFALRTAVDEICDALATDGLAALRLAVKLDREDDEPLRLERSVLPPTRESAALLRSLRWALEERAHIGRVIGCAIEVREAEAARGRQIGLFAADGARWEEAIASARYLREKLGTGRVLRARVADADARLPERAAEWKEVIS